MGPPVFEPFKTEGISTQPKTKGELLQSLPDLRAVAIGPRISDEPLETKQKGGLCAALATMGVGAFMVFAIVNISSGLNERSDKFREQREAIMEQQRDRKRDYCRAERREGNDRSYIPSVVC